MESLNLPSQDKPADIAGSSRSSHTNPAPSYRPWPVYHRSIHIHETDQDGVVHFSNYLRIAEEAMFGGFRALGYSFERSAHSVAMLDATAKYITPMKFGDRIAVVLTDCAIKRVKFMLTFEFRRNREVCAKAQLTLVTILIDGRKAIQLPEVIKAKLTKLSDPSQTRPNRPL